MTIEEFDNARFGHGDKAIYKNKEYLILQVDFEERLVCLIDELGEEENWVRCENILFHPSRYNGLILNSIPTLKTTKT